MVQHSKGRDPLAGLSAVNPTTAGFAGPCTPLNNRCSCTEISHSSECLASRCQKNQIWRCTQEVVRGSTRNALGLERGAWVRLPPSPPENEFCYSKMQARFFFLYLLKLETCFWKVRGKGGVFPNEKRKAKHFDSL